MAGSSTAEVSKTFVSLEGSKGGRYDGVASFFDGLACIGRTVSSGDGTEIGQGTKDVGATTEFKAGWFMGVGDVMANKGFGTGIDSLSVTFVFAGTFVGFTFRLREAFFLIFGFGLLCCGGGNVVLGGRAVDELGRSGIVPCAERPLAMTPMFRCSCLICIVLCVGARAG